MELGSRESSSEVVTCSSVAVASDADLMDRHEQIIREEQGRVGIIGYQFASVGSYMFSVCSLFSVGSLFSVRIHDPQFKFRNLNRVCHFADLVVHGL